MDLKNWNRFLLHPNERSHKKSEFKIVDCLCKKGKQYLQCFWIFLGVSRIKRSADFGRRETGERAGTREVVLSACRPWQLFSVPGKRRPPMRSLCKPADMQVYHHFN